MEPIEVICREPKGELERCLRCGELIKSDADVRFKCAYCGEEFCGWCFKPDYDGKGDTIKCPRCENLLKLPKVKGNDCCVLCGAVTPYKEETPEDERLHYVGKQGQLCSQCYLEIYGFCACWECRLNLLLRGTA